MPNQRHHKQTPPRQLRVAAYAVDMEAGEHRYAFAEGVGECRAHFMRMVEDVDRGAVDMVMAAPASLLYVDTSPMWMEKFITSVKRRGIPIIDATTQQEYDLRKPEDETAFRALKQQVS